LPRSCIAEPK
jgi:hypothetical protein